MPTITSAGAAPCEHGGQARLCRAGGPGGQPGVITGCTLNINITVDGQSIKVIEKNDGVNIYEAGQTVRIVVDPRDVMAYPAQQA